MSVWKRPAAAPTGRPTIAAHPPVVGRSQYSMWMWRSAVVLPHPALRSTPCATDPASPPAEGGSRA